MLHVPEVLGSGKRAVRQAEPGTRRLVHLSEVEHRPLEHLGALHLEPQVVALARTLSDAAEDAHALVDLSHVADQLHDHDGLAHAGAAEQGDLAAARERREQVDGLQSRLEHLGIGLHAGERHRLASNRPALVFGNGAEPVGRLTDAVEDASPDVRTHRHADRILRVVHLGSSAQAVGRPQGERPDHAVAEQLHGFERKSLAAVASPEQRTDLGQRALEPHVDDRAQDLRDHTVARFPAEVLLHLLERRRDQLGDLLP